MSKMTFLTRGGFLFTSVFEDDTETQTFLDRAEQKLIELMRDYDDPFVNRMSWEWVNDALSTVVGILSNAPDVLEAGLIPAIASRGGWDHEFRPRAQVERAPDFLLDTWKYIRTGNQLMHPRNWRDLIRLDGPNARASVNSRDVQAAKELVLPGYNTKESIYKLIPIWINQPERIEQNGALSHVIQTLHVIFVRP